MMSEFHDILPGTSIQPVEETSLRLLKGIFRYLSTILIHIPFAESSSVNFNYRTKIGGMNSPIPSCFATGPAFPPSLKKNSVI